MQTAGAGGEADSVAARLETDGVLSGLTAEEARLVCWLASEEMGQAHLFAGWSAAAPDDKRRLLRQVAEMDARYPEDAAGARGLAAYVSHARTLLAESAADLNPFDGYTVSVPRDGERMEVGTASFRADEARGGAMLKDTVFVLVAGGLGERLGFDGIKVALPAETLSGATFLEIYCTALRAIEEREGGRKAPLVIMTSEDTHALTEALLLEHGYYGLQPSQVHLLRQANVPALGSNAAAFVASEEDPFTLLTKPHGHGDVHTLLHGSGLLPAFAAEGRSHVVFFQDTNVLAFKAIPAALGVSERLGLAMNSLAVPRAAGEAAGAICRLQPPAGDGLVMNVEYNQLDALLRSTGGAGDEADGSGYSPYPGNVNTLVVALGPYADALAASGGAMPEFVNPKYADASRSGFKKPTRLECMMQELPKLLPAHATVGFTQFERWFSFSPVKNAIGDAVAQAAKGNYAASPGAGEAAVYEANAALLRLAGATVEAGAPSSFLGLTLGLSPPISLSPRFALTTDELMRRVSGGAAVRISAASALELDGDIELSSLDLDGALSIRASPGVSVVVRGATVRNAGWCWESVEPGAAGMPAGVSIRGYALRKEGGVQIELQEPGRYEVSGGGVVTRL